MSTIGSIQRLLSFTATLFLLLIIGVSVCRTPVFGQVSATPSFLVAPRVPTNLGGPSAVAAGDFNRDGKPDLAIGAFMSLNGPWEEMVSIFLGNGDGTFQPPVNYNVAQTPSAQRISVMVTGDFNNDGKTDLVVADGQFQTSIMLGNGDGTFQPAVAINGLPGGAGSIAVADFNGDGKLDLLVAVPGVCCGGNNSYLLYGNGDGTFQSPVPAFGCCISYVATADLNNDGKPDVLLNNGGLSVYLNNGGGAFTGVFSIGGGTLHSSGASALFLGDFERRRQARPGDEQRGRQRFRATGQR